MGMSETTEATNPTAGDLDSKVPCRYCKEPIARGARLCVHCKSGQTRWGRVLTVSTPTLALLTAIIAIVGGLAPEFKKTFIDPRDAQLNATILDEDRNEQTVSLLIDNDGPKIGALVNAYVVVPFTRSSGQKGGLQLQIRYPHDPAIVIAPKSSAVHTLAWKSGASNDQLKDYYDFTEAQQLVSFDGAKSKPSSLSDGQNILDPMLRGKHISSEPDQCRLHIVYLTSSGQEKQSSTRFMCALVHWSLGKASSLGHQIADQRAKYPPDGIPPVPAPSISSPGSKAHSK